MARLAWATATLLLLLGLLSLSACCSAQQFWNLTWTNTDLLRVTIAEPLVVSGFKSYFNTSDVYALDVRQRNGTGALVPMAGSSSTFQMLLLVGSPSNISNATSTVAASQSVNSSSSALVMALVANISAATNITTAFLLDNVNLSMLSSQAALLYAPFPCLTVVPVPANGTNFMTASVEFRNLVNVDSLTQSLIYQTRLGMARFLSLPSVKRVVPTSPAKTASANVLRIVQNFYVILGNDSNVTLAQREVLANLLIYGDPSRPVIDDGDSNLRPSVFLDYIFTPPEGYVEDAESYGSVILSFLFSSVTVEQFPVGNPPAPAPTPPPGTLIPATPNSVLVAMQRKRQRFLYDSAFEESATSTSVIADLTAVLTNTTVCTTGSDGFCTYIYWTNTLDRTFWVERMESVERVGWDMFPGTTFFSSDDPTPSFLSPLVLPGNESTPLWTLGALSGPSNRLDFALYLRNVDDNATLLHVEIATDIRSKAQATSTVTSIARDTSGSPLSIYETKSNLAISYQSYFRHSNQVILMMNIHESNATTKDTSQPCAHCQNVYDWCQQHAACAALSSCVFQAGIDAAQIPSTMLANGTLQDATPELWPYFQSCMTPIANDTNASGLNLDGLLMLSSAVRCQMQRVCAFRTDTNVTRTAGTDSTNDGNTRILIWESGEASQQIRLPGNLSNPVPNMTVFNVSVQLGARVLCYLPIQMNTTTSVVEDWLTRSCHLSKYFGRVRVTVSNRSDDLVLYAMYTNDSATIRYKYLAGPLPVLQLVSISNSSSNGTSTSTSANQLMINSTMPSIRLRLLTKAMLDPRNALPPIQATTPPDPCTTTCRTLALDVCMRDSQCVAFTDCISRYPSRSGGSMSEAILDAFQQPTTSITDPSLSFSDAIEMCHSVDMVNDVGWRKLLDVSACYSRNACPIALDWLIPLSKGVVAQWQLEPTAGVQMLMYEAEVASDGNDSDVQIPLELMRDGEIVCNMTSGIDDPLELQANLRDLLSYEYINVTLKYDSAILSPTSPRSMTWQIEYDHWLGSLPRFLSNSSYPPWTLFTSQTQDALLVFNANASSMANSTSSSSSDFASVSVSPTSTSPT